MLQRLPKKNIHNIPPQVWVAIGSITIIAASAYPVFVAKPNEREGHDLFSSEKPAAIRDAQEAREREYRQQQLQQRRAQQLQVDQEALRLQQQQQSKK